ncbi:DUF6250 domain-containing protein [Chitinophaga rhizophila]|uniref:DUF6250 domain-containing protein n=1 Tax=Chitinophaga rhizophila TaxID=2866212 RepID=A0ABS7GGZ7_9BACT|nr:DUF6250 domain-containing protein [Chitinophaga rhizophila]MBW8686966.1 hypothetical protein [Chitinophaga rhizophila]
MKRLTLLMILLGGILLTANGQPHGRLYLSDSFDLPLDTSKWIVETAPAPDSYVYTYNGRLVLDTKGGVTVWLNRKLKGNLHISFTRKVVMEGKVNDRLSDMNVFWMATDPRNGQLFTRNGVFEEYDSLSLYYVGMGGNTNTTTRFRRYDGNGKKPLLQEYLDAMHLLTANKDYQIDITVKNGLVTFAVDNTVFFTYNDPEPLREGYFGFRSTWSRQEIRNFKVSRL